MDGTICTLKEEAMHRGMNSGDNLAYLPFG
jgi:hypothetical protein